MRTSPSKSTNRRLDWRPARARDTYAAGVAGRAIFRGVPFALDDLCSSLLLTGADAGLIVEVHAMVPDGYWEDVLHLIESGLSNAEAYSRLRTTYGWHPDDRRAELESMREAGDPRFVNAPDSQNIYAAAEVFAQTFGKKLMYVRGQNWYVWNGCRWVSEPDSLTANQSALALLTRFCDTDAAWDARRASWLKPPTVDQVVRGAKQNNELVVEPSTLDRMPTWIATPDGLYSLTSDESRQATPADRLTHATPVSPDFSAAAPLWNAMLREAFGSDDVIEYVQTVAGLTLRGDQREQRAIFVFGPGRAGKSSLWDVISMALGDADKNGGYAGVLAPEVLHPTGRGQHPTIFAYAEGKRLLVSDESDDPSNSRNPQLNVATVKRFAGNRTVNARRMNQDSRVIELESTVVHISNFRFHVPLADDAFWRRFTLIPHLRVVRDDAVEGAGDLTKRHIAEEVFDREGPQILAWLIEGARRYAREGLIVPAAVAHEVAKYRAQSSPIHVFADEYLEFGTGAAFRTSIADLHAAFEEFCADMKTPGAVRSASALTRVLEQEYNCHPFRSAKVRGLGGVRVARTAAARKPRPEAA